MSEHIAFDEDFIAAFRAELARPEKAHKTHALEMSLVRSQPSRDGARGRFFVTPHAVHRYVERYHRRGLSYEQARDELVLITSAGKLVGPTHDGAREMWRGPRIGTKSKQDRRSRMRFVVGRDEPGELPQVVTVLEMRRVRDAD